jgi:hypothetical protein
MLITRGRLWAQTRINAGTPVDELERRLAASWQRYRDHGVGEPDHDSVDDMHILSSWLARHEGHPAIMNAEGATAGPDWGQVALRAIALRADELDFDAWRKERDVRESGWDEPDSAGDAELKATDLIVQD